MGNGNSTKSMGLEHRYGQTGRSTTVSGKTTTWMVTDFINMQIRFVMTDNLLVIKSKDMVYILGLMVADTKDILSMIRGKAMEYTRCLITILTQAAGSKENSTVLAASTRRTDGPRSQLCRWLATIR